MRSKNEPEVRNPEGKVLTKSEVKEWVKVKIPSCNIQIRYALVSSCLHRYFQNMTMTWSADYIEIGALELSPWVS